MTAHVISHRRPRGKRAGAWTWFTRRFGALVVTCAALFGASWLAPDLHRAAPIPALPPRVEMPALPPVLPELVEVDAALDLAGAPTRDRSRPRRIGLPLNASAIAHSDGYEILSASELAGISQARN